DRSPAHALLRGEQPGSRRGGGDEADPRHHRSDPGRLRPGADERGPAPTDASTARIAVVHRAHLLSPDGAPCSGARARCAPGRRGGGGRAGPGLAAGNGAFEEEMSETYAVDIQ